MRKFFQIGFVFLCSAGATFAADLSIVASSTGGGNTSLNAHVAGNSCAAVSGTSACGGKTAVNLHASGNSAVNVAADSFGPASLAESNVDVRTSHDSRADVTSFNQAHYGRSVNDLAAVATHGGEVDIDQVTVGKQSDIHNTARGTATLGGNTKLVSTVIANQSDVDISNRGSTVGRGARLEQEVLADVFRGNLSGNAVGSATALKGAAVTKSQTVIQNKNVDSKVRTTTSGCRAKATFTADFRSN
jgi:hypothetical protein